MREIRAMLVCYENLLIEARKESVLCPLILSDG
jgi:hypothetical protein